MNTSEIIYNAQDFASGSYIVVQYPIGLKYYMFDTTGAHTYSIDGGQEESVTNKFELIFGASQLQITNLTGASITGTMQFNLSLLSREPSDQNSSTILLIELPTFADFPQIGTSGRVYVDTEKNIIYRWTGDRYATLPSLFDAGAA